MEDLEASKNSICFSKLPPAVPVNLPVATAEGLGPSRPVKPSYAASVEAPAGADLLWSLKIF